MMANHKNREAHVVVIGRARSGKSFLGNQLMNVSKSGSDSDSDDETEEVFGTNAGDDSFTMEIQTAPFKDVTVKKMPEKYDITYTDTPGFPDTRGPKHSIEIYDLIIEFINKNKPTAIIWNICPTRVKVDADLYRTYALLMQEFSNKGIYCAVLANCQGYVKMKKKQRVEALIVVMKILKGYGLKDFCDDDPYISVSAKELKKTFLAIATKGIVISATIKDVSHFRKFEELVWAYTGNFDASEATELNVKLLRREIETKQTSLSWHESRVRDLNNAIEATIKGAAVLGRGLALFTFGMSAVVAGAAVSTAVTEMQMAVDDSCEKIPVLQDAVHALKAHLDSQNIENVIRFQKKSMRELSKIYFAMDEKVKAQDLVDRANNLSS